jgi:hypothetical protein
MRRALASSAATVVVAIAFGVASAPAGASSCPALDYEAGLAAAVSALQKVPADIAGAQDRVIALVAADGASAVALQPVLTDLSGAPPDVGDALLRLSSMSAALAYPRGSVCSENADAARATLRGVYASPDFRHLDENNQPGLLATIFNAIAGLLARGAGALGPVGAVLLAAAVLAAALALVWRRWRGGAALGGAGVEEPAAPGDDPDAEWRAAERAAASGEYREAVRRAFRSALLEVAISGHAHIDGTWTTRELLQRVDASGDTLAALAAAAPLFERAWYSGAAVTRGAWTRAEERCATVRHLARGAVAGSR